MQPPSDTGRQNARRRPELNINTAAAGAHKPSSSSSRDAIPALPPMPQTPPSRKPPPLSSKGKSTSRALRVPTTITTSGRPTGRDAADIETFLESITPVDMSNKENDRPEPPRPNPRDSHDLSLSPRQVTRDSLVTNMLLSLDQFSMGQASAPFGSSRVTYDDPSLYIGADESRAMTFTSRAARGNGHSYSYSSDFDGADDSSRVSSQPSRGRRSNSSSGFQSNLGRINSMRETSRQPGMAGGGRALHSRSGKTSKSSSINSIDQGYAQVLSSQRWAQGFGGRSSSFDYGQTAAAPNVPGTQPSPWHIEFSNSFFNEDYEAAPTPTVPGGPRRLATVPSLPVLPPPPPPEPPTPERKRSTRSSRSATVGGRRPDPKPSTTRDVPPVPTFDLDSAPAPHVGYEKSKETVHSGPNATSQPPKDRPSFFRRMFGSSRNNLASPSALENAGSSPYVSSTSVETTASRSLSKSSAPPSRESHHSTTHTIQKKTSSFFRRRKQSFTDTEPPPPLPISAVAAPPVLFPPDKGMLSPRPEPSPITSLRRAMDPYLHGSGSNTPHPLSPESAAPSNLDILTPRSVPLDASEKVPSVSSPGEEPHDAERARNVRGFSPDYEPSPKAVIRTVEQESAESLDPSPKLRSPARMETPNRQPPKPPVASSSFLQDNSDSESSPKQQKKDARAKPSDRKLRPEPSDHRRAPSPSPSVVKSKSSPNLGRARAELAVPNNRESKFSSASSRDGDSALALPIEGVTRDGSISDSKSAISVPSVKIDSADISPKTSAILQPTNQSSSKLIDEPHYVMGDPTEDDRQKAQGIFDGNEDFIQKEKAASWMGEEGPVRQRTLRAYMDLYDFNNQSVVASLRQVCGRLVLRAETQQVDRILVAFSRRWCDCNPNHGFKAMDIIHTICYSIMLLNTDLHMAEIESKMTRSQFIKNTMTTIKQALEDSAPDAFQRPSILPDKGQSLGVDGDRPSGDYDRRSSFRASFKPPPRSESALGNAPDQLDGCGPLVKNPFDGNFRAWEGQVEIVLKETYASIRDERLPLFGAESSQMQNQGGLSVMNMLKRTPSVLSKAPSDTLSTRGRIPESVKATASRWTSKSRSRPRGFGGNGLSSSRTSFDDGNSIWSPTESSATWSRQSLGRTHTSMSIDSFGSSYPRGDYQQSIGFANALSQAITRDDQLNAPSILSEELKSTPLLEDESLELAGPPWVKEGIVTHKHHLDGIDKKAKDRNWNEVFAVVQKGQISLFSFSPNKSLRKGRSRGHGGALPKGAVVGGGNWQENATNVGTFSLRQTLASALPPPGYSRSRPHVWALSLPTGAVHLFQVGTPEISKEFVNTANYWSARLSTHPLVGGISNIEYGWSDAIVQNSLVTAINESTGNLNGRPGTEVNSIKGHSRPGSAANAATMMSGGRRGSVQSRGSVRSASLDFPRPGSGSSGALGSMGPAALARHGKLPGDKIHIAEWAPPQQSMRPSNMSEQDQLDTLLNYVRGIEEELQTHNSLRSPMLLAFTPRGSNATKAMANWQRKSEYLLREIVKFRTYVDGLQAADVRKNEIYGERETARRAANGEDVDNLAGDDGSLKKVLSGDETEHERPADDQVIEAQ